MASSSGVGGGSFKIGILRRRYNLYLKITGGFNFETQHFFWTPPSPREIVSDRSHKLNLSECI